MIVLTTDTVDSMSALLLGRQQAVGKQVLAAASPVSLLHLMWASMQRTWPSSRRWAALLGRRMEAHAACALSNVVGLQSLKGWTASVTALRTHIVNQISAPLFDS